MKNKDVFDENYNKAMLKLAKNQFKKPTTAVVNKRSVIEQRVRQKFIKDEDYGTWWREQE